MEEAPVTGSGLEPKLGGSDSEGIDGAHSTL